MKLTGMPRCSKGFATTTSWKFKATWDEDSFNTLLDRERAKRAFWFNSFGMEIVLSQCGSTYIDMKAWRNLTWRWVERLLVWRFVSRSWDEVDSVASCRDFQIEETWSFNWRWDERGLKGFQELWLIEKGFWDAETIQSSWGGDGPEGSKKLRMQTGSICLWEDWLSECWQKFGKKGGLQKVQRNLTWRLKGFSEADLFSSNLGWRGLGSGDLIGKRNLKLPRNLGWTGVNVFLDQEGFQELWVRGCTGVLLCWDYDWFPECWHEENCNAEMFKNM